MTSAQDRAEVNFLRNAPTSSSRPATFRQFTFSGALNRMRSVSTGSEMMTVGTSPSKSFPIVAWPCADSSQKCPTHRIRTREAAARRHALQRGFALLEQSPRRIDPRHFDEVRGRGAGLDLKDPGKVTHAHGDPMSQYIQGQIEREMIEDSMLRGSNLALVGHLRRQMRAELRLAAGTLQKHHQPARHHQC